MISFTSHAARWAHSLHWRDSRRLSAPDATLEWVDWFNNRSLLESIGDVPPAEFEEAYYVQMEGQAMAA